MVMASVIDANSVRDVQPVRSKSQPKGAVALTADQLRDLLMKLQTSGFCEKARPRRSDHASDRDGIRRSELLALRWSDFDEKSGELTVAGKLIRVPGEGLLRVDQTKSAAGRRTIPLRRFAVEMLNIFPSTPDTLPDPTTS